MCRWMAWHGQPVLMEELLFKTQHGLIDHRGGRGAPVPAALGGLRRQRSAVLLMSADLASPSDEEIHACGAQGFVHKSRLAATDLSEYWPAPRDA